MTQDLFPVAVLLTGINQPDHYEQFEMLSERICENPNVRTTILLSRDASTLKSAIEHLVSGFINDGQADDSDEEDGARSRTKLKKGNCIMRALRDWYMEKKRNSTAELVLSIIIPDFELFNKDVLRDLMLTVSYYRSQIPLVLVFGVATTVSALENTLPLQFTSKAKFHVFKSQSSINNLNSIVERIILSPRNNFMPSGKSLQLLVEIFLFYDFSIRGFIQGYKFAMLEHFSSTSEFALCDDLEVALKRTNDLSEEDVENLRKLMSVRRYIETRSDPQDIINLLCDEVFFLDRLREEWLPNVHKFNHTFFVALKSLHILMHDLPRSPYGRMLRELYCTASEGIDFDSEEFQSTLNCIQFSTKTELLSKMRDIVKLIEEYQNNVSLDSQDLNKALVEIKKFWQRIQDASVDVREAESATAASTNLAVGSRQELKERLMEMSKQQQNQRSPYQLLVVEFIDYLRKDFFGNFLISMQMGPPLIELFIYSDSDTLRKHVVGAPRSAIHQALVNPHYYLDCDCCQLKESSQLTATQPDLSIVYKLHLECGKLINLYDWLQAFKAIVTSADDEDEDSSGRNVDPVIL